MRGVRGLLLLEIDALSLVPLTVSTRQYLVNNVLKPLPEPIAVGGAAKAEGDY